jgi:RimJ/RimL family protein N-acetyltransferase
MRAPVLRTPRLLLRPYERGDLKALHEYRSHPEWGRYVSLPQPYTLDLARLDLEEYINLDATIHAFWAIEHEGRAVGNIDAHRETSYRALAGWGLARHLWGRGLTTEAAQAVMDWAFKTWPIRRFYAEASSRNIGSWRVMEKLGMQREATLRLHREDEGVASDEVWYGILREEWAPTT